MERFFFRPGLQPTALTVLAAPLVVVVVALLPVLGARAHASEAAPAPSHGVWPLDPRPEVVSGFAPPVSRWGAGHRGVDLLGSPGQPVRAVVAGTVTFAGRLAGRGVVVVSHGRTRSTYEPVAATVAPGDQVRTGSQVGRLELLGSHCLPRACLHWGLLEGEVYLDPLSLVGGGPVRLLPWRDEDDGPTVAVTSTGPAALPGLLGWQPLGQGALFRG